MEVNYFTILYWFCHTSTWICRGYTHVPHPESPSLLVPSLWVISVHQPQASSIMLRTWTGNSFHIWYYTCFHFKVRLCLLLTQAPGLTLIQHSLPSAVHYKHTHTHTHTPNHPLFRRYREWGVGASFKCFWPFFAPCYLGIPNSNSVITVYFFF